MRLLGRLLAGLLLAVAVAGGGLVATAGPAAACSCVEPTIEVFDEMDHDLRFAGAVAKRQVAGDEVILTMRVDRVYQGEVTKRVDVVGAESGAACGLEAQEGDDLIVFAHLVDGEVGSDLCSTVSDETKYYRQLSADLGEGTAPSPGYMEAERQPLGLTYDQFVAGRAVLGVLGLLSLGYFVFRAWRARRRTS